MMIHNICRDEKLEHKIQEFLDRTGGTISDIVVSGGADLPRYDDTYHDIIGKNVQHVLDVIKKYKNRARIHEHLIEDYDSCATLVLDTRQGVFEILFEPDERKGTQPHYVRNKVVIRGAEEEWLFDV